LVEGYGQTVRRCGSYTPLGVGRYLDVCDLDVCDLDVCDLDVCDLDVCDLDVCDLDAYGLSDSVAE